jgi:hypothetical protein
MKTLGQKSKPKMGVMLTKAARPLKKWPGMAIAKPAIDDYQVIYYQRSV